MISRQDRRETAAMPWQKKPGRFHVGASRHAMPWLRFYQLAVVWGILGIVYLDLPSYWYTLTPAFLPKYVYSVAFISILPIIFLRHKAFLAYLGSPFVLWACALIFLSIIHLATASDGTMGVISTRIQFLGMAVFLGFACVSTPAASYARVFSLAAIVIAFLVMYDFFFPWSLYPIDGDYCCVVPGRGAGTFMNSTKAGEALLLTLLLGLPGLSPRQRLILIAIVGSGVLLTFSRAAMIGWLLMVIAFVATRAIPKTAIAIPLLAFGALFFFLNVFEGYLSGRSDLEGGVDNLVHRLSLFQTGSLGDDSATERALVRDAGITLFLENPVFGAGAGVTNAVTGIWPFHVGPHNQLILLGAEYGVTGLFLWCWLVYILWKGRHFENRRLQIAAACLFVFFSMFSHNLFDLPYWLLTFALVSGRRRY